MMAGMTGELFQDTILHDEFRILIKCWLGRCIPTDHTKKKKKANDQEHVSQDGESLDEEQQVRLLQDQQQQMQEQ